MKSRAAVAWAAGKPLSIEEVEVAGPKQGEVLVKVTATGVCHTDAFTLSGQDPEGLFPAIMGHEGGATVVEAGPGVTSIKPGDHVIPLYIPECGNCKFCRSGRTNLCGAIRLTQGKGLMPDGTSRFSHKGQTILHYMGTSTFSEYTVLPEIAVAKINPAAPLEKVCLLGCGITTGIGAVLNTAKVRPGSTAAVFGLGGIGLSVIQGLVMAQAERIIAVDTNREKFQMAKNLGATDFISPQESGRPVQEVLIEMTDGGVDYSFECIGNVQTMRAALEAAHALLREWRRAGGLSQGLGRIDHHRSGRRRSGDQHETVSACHGSGLAGYSVRRSKGPITTTGLRRKIFSGRD